MPQLAIYHEHPDWFRPLFAELERRGIPYVRLAADRHVYDPSVRELPYSLVFNRASPSAYKRGHLGSIFGTFSWLAHLERLGIPVINGSRIFAHEISKARQLVALEELKIAYPRARVITGGAAAVEASAGLRFPIIVKANVGGSGAGITRYDSEDALAAAVSSASLDLGVDGTALVQEALRHAKEAGVRTVDLTSRPSREAAGRLYEKTGFVQRDSRLYRYSFE